MIRFRFIFILFFSEENGGLILYLIFVSFIDTNN